MSDPRPNGRRARRQAVPATSTRPENYRAEESVGYMMRRILTAVSQSMVERTCASPAARPIRNGFRCTSCTWASATTVAELARECQLDTGAMTRLLDRLEAKGLCRRVRSLADRRVVNIELTDEGRAAAEEVPARALAVCRTSTCAGFSDRRVAAAANPAATGSR